MLHDVTLAIFDPTGGGQSIEVVQVDAEGGDDAASRALMVGQQLAQGRAYRVISVFPAAVPAVAAEEPAQPRRGRTSKEG